jgi:glycosyltransferase involved in cell wall biosynthesis
MSVSVIVITKNEEANIERCLASVSWADEIVVVDSGSSDRTVEIARRFTPRIFNEAWRGFGPQKALALSRATGDWVLSLDADEWVTAELAAQLRDIAAKPPASAADRLPRRSSFCGRFLKHSGWWPDYVTRFFRRGSAEFSQDLVHERLIVTGRTATLKQPLMHESYRSLEQVLDKMNLYSTLSARGMHAQGRRGSLLKALGRAVWAFLRTYFFRAGFLDGREGFLVAVATAESTFYRYLKLVYLREETHGQALRKQ